MPWVKIDERARCHPKFFRAGHAAFGWWVGALSYCNELLTNGFIPTRDLELVYPGTLPADREAAIESLVREGSLHVVAEGHRAACDSPVCKRLRAPESGYLMHDYLVFQPAKKHVEKVRRVRSASARKGREKASERRQQNAHVSREQNAHVPSRPVPSQPDPSRKEEPTTLSGSTPDGAHKRNGFSPESREVLTWLNDKAGKNFRPVAANLTLIQARLGDGITSAQLRAIVTRKVREWSGTDQAKYLRPETLFNRTKCEQYIGELPRLEASVGH